VPNEQEARIVARRIHALSGGAEIVRKAAARELANRDPLDANELLDLIVQLARRGDFDASCVLPAFVAALAVEADQIPHARSLKRLAGIQDLERVATLFPEGPAALEMDAGAAAKADARNFTESLGHLKTKARNTRDKDEMGRMAMASNPAVVRQLLLNPRMTEDVVLRIASRRPARPEPLVEIWKAPKWSARHSVRRALVFNPYLPPEIGAKIVPLLTGSDLEELRRAESLHPELRRQATVLLAKPPTR
jgi:hypothetical protein